MLLITDLSELANVTVSRFIGAHRIEQEAEHRLMLMFQKAFEELLLLLCCSQCFFKLPYYIRVVENTFCVSSNVFELTFPRLGLGRGEIFRYFNLDKS